MADSGPDRPFIYALWLLRPDLPDAAAVARDFRALKSAGLAHLPEIVETEREATAEFRRRYLTEHIRFEFGAREKAGMEQLPGTAGGAWLHPAAGVYRPSCSV